ncbi:MAG: TonB-dependent receptor, partial [Bacteroidia bacterium]|nr:TonB-dependent receptor [Bacteroidia bacterium]
RANLGTGFRIVNLFTEDHAFVTGQREVIIEEELAPERSVTGTLSFHQLYRHKQMGSGSVDLDLHGTQFSNRITPNYEVAGAILYGNSEGLTRSYGLSVQWNHSWREVFQLNVGANWLRVNEEERDGNQNLVRVPVAFAPRWSGVLTASYVFPIGLTLAYTAQWTGPMRLPEVYDLDEWGDLFRDPRDRESRAYAQHHLRISQSFPALAIELYSGVTNLLDFRQPVTPLSGFNDPNYASGFSPWFDTAYSYAPIHGREWFVGVQWKLTKA